MRKKQKLAEQASKTKKDVDRKASKNRKIRYVVHDKILNFLTPQQNLLAVEGREALVANLFGAKKKLQQTAVGKKRKSGGKPIGVIGESDEDDIALI